MKFIKILLIIFIISSINQAYTQNLATINQHIDDLSAEIKIDMKNKHRLYQIDNELSELKQFLQNCIASEGQKIQQYQTEISPLIKINQLPYGLAEKNKRLKLLHQQQDIQSLCQYIDLKIDFYKSQILKFNKIMHQESFISKNESIFAAFHQLAQSFFFRLPFGFIIKFYIHNTISILSIKAIICGFFLVGFFKILGRYNFQYLRFLQGLSVKQYLKATIIYAIFAPVQFLALKIIFFHYGEDLLMIFRLKLMGGMILVFVVYVYIYYKPTSWLKDCLSLIFYMAVWISLIHYCLEVIYLKLNNGSEIEIFSKKVIILLLLQPLIFSISEWMFIKILQIKACYRKYLRLWYLFALFNFIMGITYYINIGININFLMLIDCIFFAWTIIIINVKKIVFEQINDAHNSFNQTIEKVFINRKAIALFHLKLILIMLYCSFLFILLFSMFSITFWSLAENLVHSINALFFNYYHYGNIAINLIGILRAVLLLLLLNLINYAISNYYANSLFIDKSSRHSACMFFNWTGYCIVFLIILKFLGFELKNIFILLGGLSLGIGLGLKNILSSFISSFILFVSPPFKYGDYIEIGGTKGYVKKVSLMETTIETPDNNIVILPNQYITSSVIQNYNYGNKRFQKVHISYVINNFNAGLERDIKTIIINIIRKNTYLFEDENHPINILFSLHAQAFDAYRLEIVFCLNNQIDIKKELTKINRKIYEHLKDIKLDLHFEDIQYPY